MKSTKNTDALVFSSFVPNENAYKVAVEYLEVIISKFSDCDIYVGVQVGSTDEWIRCLKSVALEIRICPVKYNLLVDSDVSGFQAALKQMHDEGKIYRNIWFAHTKGVTAERGQIRSQIIRDFFGQRERITAIMSDRRIGVFGNDISITSTFGFMDRSLEKLCKFPYQASDLHYLYTFFVMNGDVLHAFLHDCKKGFFSKNLVKNYGFDRYFFERDFPIIAEKYGYILMFERWHQHGSHAPVTTQYINELVYQWSLQLPDNHSLHGLWPYIRKSNNLPRLPQANKIVNVYT